MRFRTVLTLAFCAVLVVSSGSSLLFVFGLFDSYASIIEAPAISAGLSNAMDAYRAPGITDRERLDRVSQSLLAISRAYGRFGVQKQELMIGSIVTLLVFLLAQAGLLLVASYFLSRLLTRPLSAIHAGVQRIQAGETSYRFPAFSGRELGLVTARLNGMLDVIAEKEARLAEQSRLLGWQEVASFLAHQIKNPLAALALSAKNLTLSLDAQVRSGLVDQSLGIVSRESRRVSDLLARFREAVRFPEPRFEECDMADLVESVAAAMPAGKVRFLLELQKNLRMAVDRGLVCEALTNLFTNSIEASGDTARITAGLRGEDGWCVITVDDDVRNVPDETARMVLHTAFSTKPEGSGLGLLFVRKVAALHGGSVSARRDADGGLVFELRLNRSANHGPAQSPTRATTPASLAEHSAASPRYAEKELSGGQGSHR